MAVLTEPRGLPALSDYTGYVRRHRLWFFVLVDLGLVLGLMWAFLQPPTFSSTASFTLAPVPVYVMRTTDELVPPEVTIDTDAQLLQSPGVQTAIATALDIPTAEVEEHVAITASPGSHVLHLRVFSTSATRSASAANAAVAAFTAERRQALGSLRQAEFRQLRLLIAEQELLLERSQVTTMLITTTDEVFNTIVALRSRLSELTEARREPVDLTIPAEPATKADHANTEVPMVSGAMIGLIAACLVGAAHDRTRRSKHSAAASRRTHSTAGTMPDAPSGTKEYEYA